MKTIDNVVALVGLQRFGKGSLVAKSDVEDAFRIIPMCPDEYHLFGFMFDDKIYYDKVLPMGCNVSASCQIFEKFSKAIQWLLLNHFKLSGLTHILDDFNFVGTAESYLCRYGLESFFYVGRGHKSSC